MTLQAALERRHKMSNLQDGNAAKRVYTVEEISEILGISRSAAYELVKKDEFKSVRIGATIRISKSSFDAWLDSREI
jgi:excisionase family DNA binding protein